MVEPIQFPNDPRVKNRYAIVNGAKYHYIYAEPKDGQFKHTVFLVCVFRRQGNQIITENRSMDGQTSQLVGDTRFHCLWILVVELLCPT
jgi:hypothetical protein